MKRERKQSIGANCRRCLRRLRNLAMALVVAGIGLAAANPILAQVAAPRLIPDAIRIVDPREIPDTAYTFRNPATSAWLKESWIGRGELPTIRAQREDGTVDRFNGKYAGTRILVVNEDEESGDKYDSVAAVERVELSGQGVLLENWRSTLTRASVSEDLGGFLAEGAELGLSETITDSLDTSVETLTYGLSFRIAEYFFLGFGFDANRRVIVDRTGTNPEEQSRRSAFITGIGIYIPADWPIHVEYYLVNAAPYRFNGVETLKSIERVGVIEFRPGIFYLGYTDGLLERGNENQIIHARTFDFGIALTDWFVITYHQELSERRVRGQGLFETEYSGFSANFVFVRE